VDHHHGNKSLLMKWMIGRMRKEVGMFTVEIGMCEL
jgi:hypothetical protein